MTFELDARLREDTHRIGRLPGGLVLLHRNATVPWFILVPEGDWSELYQLPDEARIRLVGAEDGLARFLRRHFDCDKVNTAALGNQVPQLHVHVIGRWEGDPCWPGPVWGRLPAGRAYSGKEMAELSQALVEAVGMEPL